MKNGWPMVRAGDVLQLQRRWITLDAIEDYVEIGVRSYGRGIFHKQPVCGASLGNKRVLRICPGDLVFMNVFAWEGAVGVAGPAEDGKIGSHRFATFIPRDGAVEPRFLQLYFQTEPGRELLGRVSPGSAGRNRTMNLAQFAEQRFPLPPLEEQRRIVALIEALAGKITEARRLQSGTSVEIDALMRSALRHSMGAVPGDDWVALTEYVADIENGWSPACHQRGVENGEWGVLKVGAVSFGTFDPTEHKALPEGLTPLPELEIKPGDFLMSRANTVQLVGACALVENTPSRLMLCDKIFRFKFRDRSKTEPRFWDWLLKSPALREQIERGASGTSSTMKNIAKPKILALKVPRVSIADQRRIVSYLDSLSAKAESLKSLQHQSAAELDALLPSILDRAFKGEL